MEYSGAIPPDTQKNLVHKGGVNDLSDSILTMSFPLSTAT